ncbi:stage II sporulation protein M [Niallia circulans]|uniref:stage II sporulation protein M n=1 Tax=Niallia circulans TaxID=1397 RepID=UPI0013DE4422|nr:stage II sporulation protein M [Niallia circulans]
MHYFKKLKASFVIFGILSFLFIILNILILTTEVKGNLNVNVHETLGIFEVKMIFIHNFLIFIIVILLGNLTFGFSTIILLAITYFFTAFRIAEYYSLTGNKAIAIFSVLLHGIFELMAISISADISFETFRRWIFPKKNFSFRSKEFFNTTLFKLIIGISLLFLAALIEIFFTSKFLTLLQ